MFYVCLILFLLPLCQIVITENDYENVLVAINPQIPRSEETNIIKGIKTMFTQASPILYKALWNCAFFPNVTILVPESWSQGEGAAMETYETADVRVMQIASKVTEQASRVIQSHSKCGAPGAYLVVDKNHAINPESATNLKIYGPPGKWLTRMWVKYRYGIFDEHGYPNDQMFGTFHINSNGKPYPTSCVNDEYFGNAGETKDFNTGGHCEIIDNMPGPSCVYFPNPEKDTPTSSLAYDHILPSMVQFCDDEDGVAHDTNSPTPHNSFCGLRSAGSVIKQHEHFRNSKQCDGHISIPPNFIPNFRIVRPIKKRFVIVFDVSASMDGDRLRMFTSAITALLKSDLMSGTYLGLVAFNKTASIRRDLLPIRTQADRGAVLDALPTSGASSTCIGCGLLAALTLLKAHGEPSGAVVILLTDGNENDFPRIDDILDNVTSARVRVNTIALGNYAPENLEKLAEVTNGKAYFVPAEKDSTASDLAVILFAIVSPTTLAINVMETHARPLDFWMKGTFVIDESWQSKIQFAVITTQAHSLLEATLLGPENQSIVVMKDSFELQRETINNVFSREISSAKGGVWSYQLHLNSSDRLAVSVIALSLGAFSDPSVKVEGWINVNRKKIRTSEDPVIISAFVQRQGIPVINVRVEAELTRPDGSIVNIPLFDNGIDPDAHADDGLYARYVTEFMGRGRYGVRIRFENKAQQAYVGVAANPVQSQQRDEHLVISAFQQVIVVGCFSVVDDADPKKQDVLRPNTVYDLRVLTSSSYENVTLTWTAPGDDFDRGQAARYEIKYSTTASDLTTANFSSPDSLIAEEHLVSGSLSPSVSGFHESLTFALPSRVYSNASFFVSLRAVDKAGNAGRASNLAHVPVRVRPFYCSVPGQKFPYPGRCDAYYVCRETGLPPSPELCLAGMVFDPSINACVWTADTTDCFSARASWK